MSIVERLMDQARQAEVRGETARQFALLRKAVRISPDYELARWQLGQVEVEGQWLAVEEAQRRAAAGPLQDEYRELRTEFGSSPAGQLALARWCRRNGLEDEARYHWTNVLSIAPSQREALRALALRWRDGQLVSRDDVDAGLEQAKSSRRASRKWTGQVARWERSVIGNGGSPDATVLDAIRAVDDVTAIPAFEAKTLLSFPSDESKNKRRQPQRLLGLAFVGALEAMTDHAATESLLRHAVLAPFDEVRDAASDRLRYRPLHDVVPTLLDGLAMPVESSFRVVIDDNGSVHYLHALYREGSHADLSRRVSRSVWQTFLAGPVTSPLELVRRDPAENVVANTFNPPRAVPIAMNQPAAQTRTGIVASRSSQRFAAEALAIEREVAATNQSSAALNERIIPVLVNVTEEDFGPEPRAWWDWWSNYNDYDQSQDRPVYETDDVTNEYVPPPVMSGGGSAECFVRGTPVWTKTGQRPIESLELGDLVLAQDVHTGELAYKPVLGRTVRPPTPILKLTLPDEELRTTRGHPLWVAGVGWRMAKELGDGAILHAINGGVRVESYAEVENAEAFNLIVAEFNTYFVGESGVLVHDNTPRRPTRASIPGVLAK
jgi:hypothetical protein